MTSGNTVTTLASGGPLSDGYLLVGLALVGLALAAFAFTLFSRANLVVAILCTGLAIAGVGVSIALYFANTHAAHPAAPDRAAVSDPRP